MVLCNVIHSPGVHGDLVTLHVFGLKDCWERNDTGADGKERGFQFVLVKECKKVGRVQRWAIVVCKT
jgi:hypothetical protein